MPKLDNAKHEAFSQEYIVDFNGSEAAIRAGYAKASARITASKLLTNPNIQERTQELSLERAKRVEIDADYVLNRLVEIDQMDFADILGEDGGFLHINQWPKVWRTYLSGFDISEIEEYNPDSKSKEFVGWLKKIKWPDKVKNLELLGKHTSVQCFKDKVALESEGLTLNLNYAGKPE